jgi:antitoxin component of MazEF toxin-antitoxin module
MYTTIKVEAKRMPDENGDLYIEFPSSLMKDLGWKPGDDVRFRSSTDGSFTVQKVNYSTIELELDDEELFKYMRAAHENELTFSEFVQKALEEVLKANE